MIQIGSITINFICAGGCAVDTYKLPICVYSLQQLYLENELDNENKIYLLFIMLWTNQFAHKHGFS